MSTPAYTLESRLYSWSFDCTPIVVTGRDVLTRELVTTSPVYHFDPFSHMIYCVDNKAYLLDYSAGDAQTTLKFAAAARDLPFPPGAMPKVAVNADKPFVANERSVELLRAIPDDILLHIFTYLGSEDRAPLLRTCARFRDVGEVRYIPRKVAERYLREGSHSQGTAMFCRRLNGDGDTFNRIFSSCVIMPTSPIWVYQEMWRHFTPSVGSLRKFTHSYPHEYTNDALIYIMSRFAGKYTFHMLHAVKEVLHHGKSDKALARAVNTYPEIKTFLQNNTPLHDDIVAMAVDRQSAEFLEAVGANAGDITDGVMERLVSRKSVSGVVYLAEIGFLPIKHRERVFRWITQFSRHAALVEKYMDCMIVDARLIDEVAARLRKTASRQNPHVAHRIERVIDAIEHGKKT